MGIEMPSAMVAIAAIITTVADVQVVGMFAGCVPLDAAGLVLAVNAFIDKERLRNELLPLLRSIHRYRAASNLPESHGGHHTAFPAKDQKTGTNKAITLQSFALPEAA